MAPTGPTFTPIELRDFLAYMQLFLHAAEVSRASKFEDLTPTERWRPFAPEIAAAKLPRRIANALTRYAWHRSGVPAASNAIAAELRDLAAENGFEISDAQLQGALLAGAYWLDPPKQMIFADEQALVEFEEFVKFVNGYLQTLPPRFSPSEQADSRNRRFRAYQRRRFGKDAPMRSPKAIVNNLPASVARLVDEYIELLLYTSPEAAQLLAANVAVALARPVDSVAAAQVELALSTAAVWRGLTGFPTGGKSHPLLGIRPQSNSVSIWNAAASRIAVSLRTFETHPEPTMSPKMNLIEAVNTIGGIGIDSEALNALSLFDDYVNAFAAWIRMGMANEVPVDQRVAAFDRSYRRDKNRGNVSGTSITAELPPSAIKILAHVDALVTRQREITGLAEELASALGDREAAKRIRRSLEVGAAWLNGKVSRLERANTNESPEKIVNLADDTLLEAFGLARQRDAEALLDLGASIAEIVRFSQTLGDRNSAPSGWWIKFHNRTGSDRLPSPKELMGRLPDGSIHLLKLYSSFLTSKMVSDMNSPVRALASTLGRNSEELCIRTLAIGLSVGVVWLDIDRISRGHRTDTLMGVEPTGTMDKLLFGRAHAQLEWGLQELLQIDSMPGV